MTATQLNLQNIVFDIAKKYGLAIDDETNFNWHEDPECPQELYYSVGFNDDKIDAIIEATDVPVFLSISEDYIRFDVDSLAVIGHHDHSKFSKKTINSVKKYIVENYLELL